MPSYVSYCGKFYAAKEMVGLTNRSSKVIEYNGKKIQPGEPFVYEGADREALKELNKQGLEFLGMDFRQNPEFLQAVRNMGFPSVKKYLESIGYNELKAKEEFEKKAVEVRAHELPQRVEALDIMGGGQDTSGAGQDLRGGFGPAPLL